MGSGKTSWAIQEMNSNTFKSYIYITPFLDEIERIKENTNIDIYDPKHKGQGKLESFNELLASGDNVVSTHSLFSRINSETQELLKCGHYTLILDEVLDVITPYTDIKKDDLRLLFENDFVKLDQDNYLIWNDKKDYAESRYADIQMLSKNKSLIYVDNTLLLWHFPVSTFELFEKVYIMTYMFDGQIMKAYYDYNDVKYSFKSVSLSDKKYSLCTYNAKNESRSKYENLINIYTENNMNVIGDRYTALSKTWYDTKRKKDKDVIIQLENNLSNYFKHKLKASSETIAWSVYKDYESQLSNMGRKYIRKLTAEEKKKKPEEISQLKCFIPCNSRATNIYADRYNLAYMVNLFVNPYILKFFKQKNIELDQSQFALCEMVQWIWRSRIRNMEPINIYIPSKRMRELLEKWIASSDGKNELLECTSFQNEK